MWEWTALEYYVARVFCLVLSLRLESFAASTYSTLELVFPPWISWMSAVYCTKENNFTPLHSSCCFVFSLDLFNSPCVHMCWLHYNTTCSVPLSLTFLTQILIMQSRLPYKLCSFTQSRKVLGLIPQKPTSSSFTPGKRTEYPVPEEILTIILKFIPILVLSFLFHTQFSAIFLSVTRKPQN